MADCNTFEPLLHCVLDGEATPEERAAVMAHLEGCETCREKFRQLTELHMAFEELDTDVPAELTQQVMETVRAEKAKERRGNHRRWSRNILAAAACCAIVFLGVRGMTGQNAGSDAAMEEAVLYATTDSTAARSTVKEEAAEVVMDCATTTTSGAKCAETVEAAMPESAAPQNKEYAMSDELLAVVVCGEPAVLEWLEENRPGETEDVLLTVEEVAELAVYLAEREIDLQLPQEQEILLTWQK